MSVRFLIFSGSWENEGNFYILESENAILILACGKGYSYNNVIEIQFAFEHLRNNKNKIKAIIIKNTDFQNFSLLLDVFREFQVPIYSSLYSKIIIEKEIPEIKSRSIIVVENNSKIKLEDFDLFFCLMNGYLIGNLALMVNFLETSFIFIEHFTFVNVNNNNLISPKNFLDNFKLFLDNKLNKSYLISNLQEIRLDRNKSISSFLEKIDENITSFFLFYDFDWLNIIELFEEFKKTERKIRIIDEKFKNLAFKILQNNLKEIITENLDNKQEENFLLVGNPEDIFHKLKKYLSNFDKKKIQFIVCLPSVLGGEVKLANIIDYLYKFSEEIIDLSKKKELFPLGISLFDLKLLINLIKPNSLIRIQRSYRQRKFLEKLLPVKIIELDNCSYLNIPDNNSLKLKRKNLSLEELLFRQKMNLGKNGLLIILANIEFKDEKILLKNLKIDNLAVSSSLDINKLEEKIKNSWEDKLVNDLKSTNSINSIKRVIEGRLNFLISKILSRKGINLGEIFFLIFS